MKNRVRISFVILAVLLLLAMAIPAFADSGIEITRQPQSPTYPEGAVAMYSVEAAGSNLHYTWFIVFEGVAYDTSKVLSGAQSQPWSRGCMEGFGVSETGNSFYFQGILPDLNGAKIYCVVSDNITSVKSAAAYIAVGGSAMPPQLVVPASMTVDVGTPVDLYCAATTNDGSACEYLWYETQSGELSDIIAINRGAETDAYLHCDTDKIGTRYYVCMVTTDSGGSAYTNAIPVIVREKAVAPKPSGETSAPKPETEPSSAPPSEEKDGLSWWMIALPVVAIVSSAATALVVSKSKKKNR